MQIIQQNAKRLGIPYQYFSLLHKNVRLMKPVKYTQAHAYFSPYEFVFHMKFFHSVRTKRDGCCCRFAKCNTPMHKNAIFQNANIFF